MGFLVFSIFCPKVEVSFYTCCPEPYPNQTLKTNFSKTTRQKLKKNILIKRGLLYTNIQSLLIIVEQLLRNWLSNLIRLLGLNFFPKGFESLCSRFYGKLQDSSEETETIRLERDEFKNRLEQRTSPKWAQSDKIKALEKVINTNYFRTPLPSNTKRIEDTKSQQYWRQCR